MKPRTGVFCISINEARETTDLEMPDLRNTFVIKVSWIESHVFLFFFIYFSEENLEMIYTIMIIFVYSTLFTTTMQATGFYQFQRHTKLVGSIYIFLTNNGIDMLLY